MHTNFHCEQHWNERSKLPDFFLRFLISPTYEKHRYFCLNVEKQHLQDKDYYLQRKHRWTMSFLCSTVPFPHCSRDNFPVWKRTPKGHSSFLHDRIHTMISLDTHCLEMELHLYEWLEKQSSRNHKRPCFQDGCIDNSSPGDIPPDSLKLSSSPKHPLISGLKGYRLWQKATPCLHLPSPWRFPCHPSSIPA